MISTVSSSRWGRLWRSTFDIEVASQFLKAWLIFLKDCTLAGLCTIEGLLQLAQAVLDFLLVTTWGSATLRLQSVRVFEP